MKKKKTLATPPLYGKLPKILNFQIHNNLNWIATKQFILFQFMLIE